MALKRDGDTKSRTFTGIPDQFVRAMDGYRNVFGAKLYEKEALELGFEELMNIPLDRIADLLRQAGRDEVEAMSMPKLIRWIKDRQKPKALAAPVDIPSGDGFDKAETSEMFLRFQRMKQLVSANGLEWWQSLARKAAAWSVATMPKEHGLAKDSTDFMLKRGPGCLMTFVVMQPWLQTQPIWEQLQPPTPKPQPQNLRTTRTYAIGNAAAYRERD